MAAGYKRSMTFEECWPKGTKVYARGKRSKPGITTGGHRLCRLEGCSGARLCVKWPDGKKTWPCTKGLEAFNGGFRIM